MNTLNIRQLLILALLGIGNASYGQICTVSIGDLSSLCNGSTASIGPVQEPGYYNVALGWQTFYSDTTGSGNTALGFITLNQNTTGNYNVAVGIAALNGNSIGSSNGAVGPYALYANTSGANNTALGYSALFSNTTGKGNAAQGVNALYSNTTGIRNLAIGSNALFNNNGSYNIALGFDAGYNVTGGSNNIEIGTQGAAGDNNTIQIGVQGTQTATTIAGVFGTPISGSAVYVTSTGQLGVQASSERFKTDIVTMPALSTRLAQLRPVTFRYKADAERVPHYGLIAEEVAKVYPELVIRDGSGKTVGVHYEELAPMLLGEMQRQQRINVAQARSNAEQAALISDQTARIAAQNAEILALKRETADLDDLKLEMRALSRRLSIEQATQTPR